MEITNIKQVKQGQIFKSYRDLCRFIGCEPKKNSKGKTYHLKDLARYFAWENEGNKFIITEVYSNPKSKVDGRKNNGGNRNNKYDELMDQLILDFLSRNKNVEMPLSEIIENLNFFQNNYFIIAESYRAFANNNNLSAGLVSSYYLKCRDTVRGCLETALNRLQRQGILTWEKKIYLKCNDSSDNCYAEDLGKEFKDKFTHAEKEVYEEMGINPSNRIVTTVNKSYKSKVVKKIVNDADNTLSLYSYWRIYDIQLKKQTIAVATDPEQIAEDLMYRFIQSITKKILNIKNKEGINIYATAESIRDLNRLHALIWTCKRYAEEQKQREKDLEQQQTELDNFLKKTVIE